MAMSVGSSQLSAVLLPRIGDFERCNIECSQCALPLLPSLCNLSCSKDFNDSTELPFGLQLNRVGAACRGHHNSGSGKIHIQKSSSFQPTLLNKGASGIFLMDGPASLVLLFRSGESEAREEERKQRRGQASSAF